MSCLHQDNIFYNQPLWNVFIHQRKKQTGWGTANLAIGLPGAYKIGLSPLPMQALTNYNIMMKTPNNQGGKASDPRGKFLY